jgi:thymidine phosphorylase
VRTKIFGYKLAEQKSNGIVEDMSEHRYSNIEIASFLSVCAGSWLDIDEIIYLTRAMVACGKRFSWSQHQRVVGGTGACLA